MPEVKVINIIEEGRYGGPQARIAQVASILKDDGIETIVVFPSRDSETFQGRLSALGVQSVPILIRKLSRNFYGLARYFAGFIPEVVRLTRLIKSCKPDIVHCNSSSQIKGMIAGKLAGVKTVWHLNDTNMPWVIRKVFEIIAGPCANGFIYAGQKVKGYYISKNSLREKPSIEIQSPVDTARFNPATAEPDPYVAALPGLKILTVGNINPDKGTDIFIRMCSALSEKISVPLSFVIAGAKFGSQAGYIAMVEKLISGEKLGNVHIIGPSDNIPGVMRAADIYVCSSRNEASPTSVWEAMSMALPVVSADVGDVAAFLEKGGCGIVAPPSDARALAAGVEKLIGDEGLRKSMGERGRKLAIQELDIKICAERHKTFYRAMLEN